MTANRRMTAATLRRIVWTSFALIVLWQPLWYVWLAPAKMRMGVALAIALIPLLPGVLMALARVRLAIVAAGFGVFVHFIYALLEVQFAGAHRLPAAVQSFLCFAFFCAWYFVIIGEKRAAKRLRTPSA